MRFNAPTRIIFGSGILSQLGVVMEKDLGASRPMIVTDRGVKAAGLLDKVLSFLPGAEVFDGVEANPRHTTVDKAGAEARKIGPDVIVGLGGGSALDAAKAVALLVANPGSIADYEGREKYLSPPIPMLAIPTTCGTGSEVTWVSVITHVERRIKISIKGPAMFPAAALVDPDFLLTLPPALIASTGIDALTHAVEAYTVKPASLITDIFARVAVQYIFSSLKSVWEDVRGQTGPREKIMLGSTLAGVAFGNSDVGSVHCLSESLGAVFDTPHGVANSICLPYIMEFNLPVSKGRYADIARMVGIREEDDEKAARSLIDDIRRLSREMGIPAFKDLGFPEDRFPEIALKSYDNNSNPSNPRNMEAEDYLKVLYRASRGV